MSNLLRCGYHYLKFPKIESASIDLFLSHFSRFQTMEDIAVNLVLNSALYKNISMRDEGFLVMAV